jgi:hypothetical protein
MKLATKNRPVLRRFITTNWKRGCVRLQEGTPPFRGIYNRMLPQLSYRRYFDNNNRVICNSPFYNKEWTLHILTTLWSRMQRLLALQSIPLTYTSRNLMCDDCLMCNLPHTYIKQYTKKPPLLSRLLGTLVSIRTPIHSNATTGKKKTLTINISNCICSFKKPDMIVMWSSNPISRILLTKQQDCLLNEGGRIEHNVDMHF